MGTELGATTSIFPSDNITKAFLKQQKREKSWKEIVPSKDAEYDEVIEIDLNALEPLIALPHSPDNVRTVKAVEDTPVNQVAIGSCTNSSLADLLLVSKTLKNKKINKNVSLVISPGSRQVVTMLAKSGALSDLIASGARILENSCGPCIGMGQSPSSGAVSLRTFNRNFEGRSGTKDAKVYLCSPEVAVAAALFGKITLPSKIGAKPKVKLPAKLDIDEKMFFAPSKNPGKTEILRGPNIKPLPVFEPLPEKFSAGVVLMVGDNITTDHIMTAGSKILPLRSNLPAISEYAFSAVDREFVSRAKASGSGVIAAGENYGQGSSREHAALAPRYLGVRAVIAKSFARIHLANLINFGIIPFTFKTASDYDKLSLGDRIEINSAAKALGGGSNELSALVRSADGSLKYEMALNFDLTQRQKSIIFA